jgi:hypothetical protein
VRKRVEAIKAMPAIVRIETTPLDAEVFVDGKPVATTTPADVSLPAGRHLVRVERPGSLTLYRDIDATYAANSDVRMVLTSAPDFDTGDICQITPDAPQCANTQIDFGAEVKKSLKRSEFYVDALYARSGVVPAIVTGGVALGATAVGTVFGVLALDDRNRLQSNRDAGTANEASNFAAASDLGFIAAGAFAVTSVILYLKRDDPAWEVVARYEAKRAPPPTLTASPFLTPHAAGAGALFRF